MKKENLVTIAKDISTFTFDLDPWNGLDEAEMMETVLQDLIEDGSYTKEFLQEVIDNKEGLYDPGDRKEAEKLLERVRAFCNKTAMEKKKIEFFDTLQELLSLGFDLDRNSAGCLIGSVNELAKINAKINREKARA